MRAGVIAVLVLGLSLCGGIVWARTGSSMGGGSFHSSSHSSSHSYSGSSHSYSGGGGSGGGAGAVGGIFIVVLVFFWMIGALSNLINRNASAGSSPALDVSVLYIAVDARARALLQSRFARIASSCDTATQTGLVKMMREVALELRRARPAWLYTGAYNAQPMTPAAAEQLFQSLVYKARAGYEDELVRAADGQVLRSATPQLNPRTEDGDGLVLVTLAVAARGVLYDVHNAGDPDQVRRALDGISTVTAARLAAVEVIWTPAAENDRMSSVALEASYPFMVKVPDVVAGKVFCSYCGGAFPAELVSCPHCGGVARAA